MRGRIKRGTLLRIVRIAAGLNQQEAANRYAADQSTVSRIESGSIGITDVIEERFIHACGGLHIVEVLIRDLQALVERVRFHSAHPLPA